MSHRRALLLVDHGSRRDAANNLLRAVCERIDQRLAADAPSGATSGAPADAPAAFAFAEYCHMELAEPTIAQGIAACVARGAREVVVMPYFLAPGRHSRGDIPRMVAEAAAAHPGLRYAVSPPLGLHDKLLDVVLERAGEGLARGLETVAESAARAPDA